MDPLTAVSLAGTVLQFVDFGCKLFKVSVELYDTSESSIFDAEQDAAKHVTMLARDALKDLQDYKTKLQGGEEELSRYATSEDEKELRALCHDCDDVATTL